MHACLRGCAHYGGKKKLLCRAQFQALANRAEVRVADAPPFSRFLRNKVGAGPRYSLKKASDCSCVISNGFRQRTFAHDNLSSRLTMYDCALANRARSRSSAPRGNCGRFRRTTQVTLYSAACPHLGQVSICVRCSVVSLKNSRSSMTGQLIQRALPLSFWLNLFHTRPCRDETQANPLFSHQGRQSQRSRSCGPAQTRARALHRAPHRPCRETQAQTRTNHQTGRLATQKISKRKTSSMKKSAGRIGFDESNRSGSNLL